MALAWPRRSAPERASTPPLESFPATHSQAAQVGTGCFSSPSLRILREHMEAPGKHEVLDLGPPLGANLAFFGQFNCRLHYSDVYDQLKDYPESEPYADAKELDQRRQAVLDAALVLPACEPRTSLDVVLAWDLFNHLSPEATLAMMQAVAKRARPGTLIYFAMVTGGEMPSEPCDIRIRDTESLEFEPRAQGTRPAPCYPPLTLERMMPGFHLLHSFLLGGRMQDYLFRFA